jgi:hypothetical protein
MVSSAEEQSITPVPFRYRGHWLQGLVHNLIHLVLHLQVQQAGALHNAVILKKSSFFTLRGCEAE